MNIPYDLVQQIIIPNVMDNEMFSIFNDEQKGIIFDYLQKSILFRVIPEIRSKLIDECHKKKATLLRKKYRMNLSTDQDIYNRYLFYNKKRITSMDQEQSEPRCFLDSCMFKKLNTKNMTNEQVWLLCDIFYSTNKFVIPDYNVNISLSDNPVLTPDDIELIKQCPSWFEHTCQLTLDDPNLSAYEIKTITKLSTKLKKYIS